MYSLGCGPNIFRRTHSLRHRTGPQSFFTFFLWTNLPLRTWTRTHDFFTNLNYHGNKQGYHLSGFTGRPYTTPFLLCTRWCHHFTFRWRFFTTFLRFHRTVGFYGRVHPWLGTRVLLYHPGTQRGFLLRETELPLRVFNTSGWF